MTFKEEFYANFSKDGVPDHTGNPLTEYGTGLLIMKEKGEFTGDDARRAAVALHSMMLPMGLWAKKFGPGGTLSPDEITKDDLVGALVMGVLGAPYDWYLAQVPRQIFTAGILMGWCLSNTGRPYPSAFARPWDIALYTLAAGARPTLWGELSLYGQILFDAFFTKENDLSSKRLMYLGLYCVEGKSEAIDSAARFWKSRIAKKYGSLEGILRAYKEQK